MIDYFRSVLRGNESSSGSAAVSSAGSSVSDSCGCLDDKCKKEYLDLYLCYSSNEGVISKCKEEVAQIRKCKGEGLFSRVFYYINRLRMDWTE